MQLSPEELDLLARYAPHVADRWSDPSGHVSVYAVLDHGAEPALGEVCAAASIDPATALEQACRLARSASIRIGLLGVARGGAAVVVVPEHRCRISRARRRSLASVIETRQRSHSSCERARGPR